MLTAKNTPTIFMFAVIAVGAYFLFSIRNGTTEPIQSHRSYRLEIISGAEGVQPGKATTIIYRVKDERGETLKNFETVHEKIMHVIIVRKDLRYFQHLHPSFNAATGEFSVDGTFQTDGLYRLFTDFTPARSADNPYPLPVTLYHDMIVGDVGRYEAQPVAVDTIMTKALGGYHITFTAPQEIQARAPVAYVVTIEKDDAPVNDLDLYLGALGHSVILRADTLDFIHTHAQPTMNMPSDIDHDAIDATMMEYSGPDLSFLATFPQVGLYKIFVQFRHEGNVLTTDFVVDVKNAPSAQQH